MKAFDLPGKGQIECLHEIQHKIKLIQGLLLRTNKAPD